MQNMKENKIIKLKYYACGYCINKLKYIIKKPSEKTKKFYAGVFLIKHEKYGYILFDTGYSENIYNCGIIGKLYNIFNPTFIKKEETITEQLKRDKIDIDSIKYVILSHLHPDHIGCVKDFKNAKIILSNECFNEYKHGSIKSLIFKKMLPVDFEKRVQVINKFDNQYKLFKGFDLYNDESIILTEVDGHFKGQICAYLHQNNVFLGADICWGLKFKDRVNEMHPFARLVQNNFKEYKKGIELINKLEDDNIRVCLCHDDYDLEELI